MHVNAREMSSGRTALNSALSLRREDVAHILVEYGAMKGSAKLTTGKEQACCAIS